MIWDDLPCLRGNLTSGLFQVIEKWPTYLENLLYLAVNQVGEILTLVTESFLEGSSLFMPGALRCAHG